MQFGKKILWNVLIVAILSTVIRRGIFKQYRLMELSIAIAAFAGFYLLINIQYTDYFFVLPGQKVDLLFLCFIYFTRIHYISHQN